MASLFQSFMEAMAPPHQIPEGQGPQTTAASGGLRPKESKEPQKSSSKQLWDGEGSGVTPMPHKMIMRWKWRI